MHYIVSADPNWITHDRHTGTWSLIDADLKRPLVGLQNSNQIDIARAILALPTNGKHNGRGGPR